jgi:hypothetical protein
MQFLKKLKNIVSPDMLDLLEDLDKLAAANEEETLVAIPEPTKISVPTFKTPNLSIPIIQQWKLDYEPSGSIFWYCSQHPFHIYATPFWEDVNGIAICVTDSQHENVYTETIPPDLLDKAFWTDNPDAKTNHPQWSLYESTMNQHITRLLTAAMRTIQ